MTPQIFFGLACVAIAAHSATAQSAPRDSARVERLAAGVYAIIHPDATPNWPHSNTGVIVGTEAVAVIDATYLPSRAAADIALIRTLTSLPVRYLVNTHWHYDHNFGNATYAAAFPGLTIVAHTETERIMRVNMARYARVASSAAESAPIEKAELSHFTPTLPNLTFESSVTLHLGGRDVEVSHWGRANTPGDAVAWLPAERVLFTGDIVVSPVPYAWGSSPVPWTDVLRRIEGTPALFVVPGHGEVQRDMQYVAQVRELIEFVVTEVRRLAAEGKTKEESRAAIDLARFRDRFVGGDPARKAVWDDSIAAALVDRAWDQLRGMS